MGRWEEPGRTQNNQNKSRIFPVTAVTWWVLRKELKKDADHFQHGHMNLCGSTRSDRNRFHSFSLLLVLQLGLQDERVSFLFLTHRSPGPVFLNKKYLFISCFSSTGESVGIVQTLHFSKALFRICLLRRTSGKSSLSSKTWPRSYLLSAYHVIYLNTFCSCKICGKTF